MPVFVSSSEWILYIGIGLIVLSVVLTVTNILVFHHTKKKIDKELDELYGEL